MISHDEIALLLRGEMRRLADRSLDLEATRRELSLLVSRYAPPSDGPTYATQEQTLLSYLDSAENPSTAQAPLPAGLGLDHYTGGIPRGVVTVIFGRPSEGKSTIKEHMIEAAATAGNRLLHLTLEDSGEKVAMRAISRATDIPVLRLQTRSLTAAEKAAAREAAVATSQVAKNITVWDQSGTTIDDIATMATELKRGPGLDGVFIDHVGAIAPTGGAAIWQTAADLARTGQALAKELNVAFVVLAHFQPHGKDDGRRPVISDIYGGQALSNAAKLQLATYRPARFNAPPEKGFYARLIAERGLSVYKSISELIIRKNWFGGHEDQCIPIEVDPITTKMKALGSAHDAATMTAESSNNGGQRSWKRNS